MSPCSTDEGKPEALDMLRPYLAAIEFVLDVGCGAGRWHDILWAHIPHARWDAIEVWEPYIARYELLTRYDRIVVGDAASVDLALLEPPYDLAIFGDVLEHLPAADGVAMVERLPWALALISVPITGGVFEHQMEWEGNPHEEHRASWTAEAVRSAFPVTADWVSPDIGVFLLAR